MLFGSINQHSNVAPTNRPEALHPGLQALEATGLRPPTVPLVASSAMVVHEGSVKTLYVGVWGGLVRPGKVQSSQGAIGRFACQVSPRAT